MPQQLLNAGGSTLEAMALAVERAAVVLICMSQLFKDSASCRTGKNQLFLDRLICLEILTDFP